MYSYTVLSGVSLLDSKEVDNFVKNTLEDYKQNGIYNLWIGMNRMIQEQTFL